MEVRKGTTGRSKRLFRVDDLDPDRFGRLLKGRRNPPDLRPDAAGSGPGNDPEPRQGRLVRLKPFRDRDITSGEALRAHQQKRQKHGDTPDSSRGSPESAMPLTRRETGGKWVALIVAVLAVAGLGLAGFTLSTPINHRAIAAASALAPAAKVGPNPKSVYALGDAFRLGPYTYTIAGHQTATTLGSQFSPVPASPGNEYVIVNFSIRNDSTKARVVSTEAFKLEDASGQAYEACSQGAAVPRTQLTKGDLWLTEIRPGVTKVLAAAFEVPAASLKPPVKLKIFEQSLLYDREATVYLRF